MNYVENKVHIISKKPRVQVEFNGKIILAGINVKECEEYYIKNYSSEYEITWLSVL